MKKCTEYTLGKTTIKKTPDYDPDTSYLGEYGRDLKPGCIIRIDKTFYEDIPDEWNTSEIKEAHYIHHEYPYFYPRIMEKNRAPKITGNMLFKIISSWKI